MKTTVKHITADGDQYGQLVSVVGWLLAQAREQVVSHINTTMVQTYWQIGRYIVEYEQWWEDKSVYGSGLLKQLSLDLTKQFGKWFSRQNIQNMKQFYLWFSNWQTLSSKLSWSHYCIIMRLDEELAREFYMIETAKQQRSVRILQRQVDSMLFERIALSNDKAWVLQLAQSWIAAESPQDLIKDPYIFEFLNLPDLDEFHESDLEQQLINHLQNFLLELGDGFSFVARQKTIMMDGDRYYIDLVFYHRMLQCFMLVDLKIGILKHQDIGQMQMYVNRYDREIRAEHEHKTIWLILCADKKETTIQYTLPEDNNQIFASKYKLYLPDKELLEQQLQQLLNS